MTVRRTLRWLGATALVVVIAFVAWSAFLAWRVSHDLSDAASEAQTLQDALTSGDSKSVDASLAQLESSTSSADDRTSGVTWSVLTKLPAFGDDARGVRLVSQVLADLSSAGIKPLAEQASDLTAFLPKDGAIPADKLQQLQTPVANADKAFASADTRLDAQSPDGFLEPLKVKYGALADKVSDASKALSDADTALKVMPSMLGADGPRNYLLVFQNNAEIRATGGLPGAVALLHVDDGKLTLTEQVSGSSFGETKQPALPLSTAERKIYGKQLGTYFLDANFTPDFPRAAALWQAHWQQRFGDQIDGVVSVDPVALSYILQATGPVTADGTTLDADNAVDQLLHQTYIDNPDPATQDAHFEALASAIFAKVTTGPSQPRALLQALRQAADERRLYVHSFDPAEDTVLSTTELEGALSSDVHAAPTVAISFDDTTGAKMSYYLRYSTQVTSESCSGSQQSLAGTVHLESLAPKDAASSLPKYVTGGAAYGIPAGSQLVTVRLYSPVGGTISALSVDNKAVKDAQIVDLDSRNVLTTYVILGAQRTSDLTWSMQTASGQTGNVTVTTTPGVSGDSKAPAVVPSACT